MRSSVASCTENFVLEYISSDSEYFLAVSMFSLNLSCLCEVDKLAFEGSLVIPGHCLFCLPILCAQPIPLAMVDE